MTKEATLYTIKVENETNIFIYEKTLVMKGRDCSKKNEGERIQQK